MTSLVQALQRNTFFLGVAATTRLLANAVLFVMVARFYGPVEFGQFTTAHTLATIFTILADFGFDMLLVTRVSARPAEASFMVPRMLGVKILLSSLAAAAQVAYALLQHLSPGARELTLVFALYLFFSALLSHRFALFRSYDAIHHESRITLVINVALIGALGILGALKVPVLVVAYAFVASRVVGLVLAMITGRSLVREWKPVLDFSWIRSVSGDLLSFGLFFVFGNLYFMIDTMLLSAWWGDKEVGQYQAVFRIVALLLVLPDISVNAILPSLSRMFPRDSSRWAILGETVSRSLFFAALPLAVLLFVEARDIVHLVYGEAFTGAVAILRVFSVIVAVRYLAEVSAVMLTTSGAQHRRTALVVAATVLNVTLNVFAIPRFGAIGAAVVSLVTNVAVACGYVIAVRSRFTESWLSFRRGIPAIALAACAWGMIFLQGPARWLLGGGGLALYAGLVVMIGYSHDERQLVRQSVRSLFAA